MWVRGEQPKGLDPLQDWALNNAGARWTPGLGIIEAAETRADAPEEGAGHQYREDLTPTAGCKAGGWPQS